MNPYELLDLDAGANVHVLTDALRAAMEAATEDAQREQLARVWEEVTQNAQTRLEYALLAGPELRACKPKDLQTSGQQGKVGRKRKTKDAALQARDALAADLIPLPSLLDLLEQHVARESGNVTAQRHADMQLHAAAFGTALVPALAWDSDPILNKLTTGGR
jgi:hypothetical protein